jgi:hypothetical protein
LVVIWNRSTKAASFGEPSFMNGISIIESKSSRSLDKTM